MKKSLFICLPLFFYYLPVQSQIGINTETPAATLDVAAAALDGSTAEGFIVPRLSGDELTGKNTQYGASQNSTLVYVTSAASATTGKTRNVNAAGYYFYDATADNGSGANSGLWIPLVDPGKQQFYMPTVLLPTDAGALPDNVNYSSTGSGAGTSYTVDLFNLYKSQYDSPAAKSATTSSLQTGTAASNYHYFVLYYDTNVFDNTSISTSGILSYSLRTGYVLSEKTFVNVVLREK